MSGLAVELDRLGVRHPAARDGAAPALADLSVRVAPGEQVVVIGPSGAGKTTLLHALGCALPPSAGSLRLDGQDPWTLGAADLRRLRARLFLAPQTPPLPPRQRVVTSVLAARLPQMGLWASLASLVHPRGAPQAHAALERFDLGDKLWERVDRLSGGERQRVGLARALLAPAALWLIDEPLSALDPARATLALRALTQVARERGVTLLATLHQVDLALANFPRVLGLRDGRLAFDLPAEQVTPALLAELYASFEHELQGLAPQAEAPVAGTAAAPAMHC
ncbi:ATP-binding cassette domain-containing protein [Hydrogenophaga sp.]|uniref:phosphonate ABC transporter ATP-binding protein n=1 Tax=Hydrogenophaga sp. TaxID=1904254 RepID=UPI0026135315|nr:ATP-binding cassette domain-containing protein [Hydrogenophaga sp.]MCW5653615.1 ATP-binding cassette domain-containing protein [Hydrogenophaga sp.]